MSAQLLISPRDADTSQTYGQAWKELIALHFPWKTMQTVGFGDVHFRKGISPSRSILPGYVQQHATLLCMLGSVNMNSVTVPFSQTDKPRL